MKSARFFVAEFSRKYLSHRKAARPFSMNSVRVQYPRLCVVRERHVNDFCNETFPQVAILDGEHDLDATQEVSGHPVRTPNNHLPLSCIFEAENPAVLQK
jgi:hypothetical protein